MVEHTSSLFRDPSNSPPSRYLCLRVDVHLTGFLHLVRARCRANDETFTDLYLFQG
jgi:hypothetical protein